MTVKIISLLLIFGLIVSGAFYVIHTSAAYELRSKLVDERSALKSLSDLDVSQEQQLRAMALEKERLEKALQATKIKLDSKSELSRLIDQAKKQTSIESKAAVDASQQFNEQVMQVRKNAVGANFLEVRLATGKVLKNVRIHRVNEDMVSVAHAEGSARLRKSELPAEWVDKFQITDPPPSPPQVTAKKTAPGESSPAASDSSAPSAPGSPAAANPAEVKELRSRIAQYEAQSVLMRGNQNIWEQRARELGNKVAESEAKGRIVTNKGKVDEAQKMAAEYARKAAEADAQATLLRGKLYSINGGWWWR